MEAKLFTGRSNPRLAQLIAEYLQTELGDVSIKDFSDGELWVRYNENVRGQDVFIIQSTNPPANNIMELLLMLDAAKRASARRVTAVIPYYGYARQDRKDQPRVPISAKLLADMINAAGADRVLTMDLHSAQIQGYFNIPFDHLYSKAALITYLKADVSFTDNLVVLSPDVGSIPLSRSYAKILDASLAIIDKRRPQANQAEVMNLIGDVSGKNVLIMDDMVDTAGTLAAAAETAKAHGALVVRAACTHGVLSGPAIERITNAPVEKLIISDTIQIPDSKMIEKLEMVSVAPVFGEAIARIHNEESISSLFNF
ncbi:MAG TPA: ribose-phosphate diphosphokinase [Candidatus Marinimicrobia bacterium]|nr:MAG: ribose-phosphate pyrophosphokinase [Candidatus Marinimicrobia bacterium CG1_02_48_14]PJA54216.1 MAG: ribose-phosphate pyrophosphokinase [Candidatus Marinimicrobia bacterium CG_4_9_14_3_um_filter_48_9]HCW77000.1 ribose-phosphate diphosphokinase [Candidatus Neomarinimicrobiota bacterium]